MADEKKLSSEQTAKLLATLQTRFERKMNRHEGLEWSDLEEKLKAEPEKLWSLNEMERTGGEPDVIVIDQNTGEYAFFYCSAESPAGRRNLCYDHKAWESRKENKPESSALDVATAMGI